ncbi:MAG: hypothetical protein A2365_03700 [Candidatus Nealsonbacteria bacterium RIFOXYB1_FULL_40_15]|uniref:Uncharacterized protein n=2 Tax=Candidatus Nealsoniibacteriota TaxID=1817911 RepID=A0A1G2ERA0_9BACT|nr:MAG: hypothetical protein A2365_03700 [Candidatus Nealsonbacteria bacterium RIFOXYB1_FULL_40_15]OGZ28335.1 MAG: hypothetical protein A2427_00295 [Candidatus Nealsonbacteria bacterium RIFOXYC1_FULL_40_7]OGZ29530.1 MAG: hypothetical protein A2562_02470 [Candidatus Nealsonbacteria bacterium RIFOXYD1_FULL_39_11]
MRIEESKRELFFEIVGFCFYLFELRSFLTSPQEVSLMDSTIFIYSLKSILLLIALPLLYIFRIAYFLGLEEAISYAFSIAFKFKNENTYLQVKIFYYFIYIFLSTILVIRFLEVFL